MELRKVWIMSGCRSEGCIIVDAGASLALTERGSSLLPSGIREVQGEFLRGSAVTVKDSEGRELAKGISRYGSAELCKISGCRTDEIESILGYSNGVAVHRNDLVLS